MSDSEKRAPKDDPATARAAGETRPRPAALLRAATVDREAVAFSHPWNDRSEIRLSHLSGRAGLERTGISRVVLPPGKESFAYHSHRFEEEWIYLLSGRAMAEVDDRRIELAAGDFLAFPTPSVAHQLSNPFDEPVVYLMGGEHREVEVADFPRLGRRMVRSGQEIEIYDLDAARPFEPEAPDPDRD